MAVLTRSLDNRPQLLRRTMRANSIFSSLSGLIALVGARPLATLTGINIPVVFTILGVALLAYGVVLFIVPAQPHVDRRYGQAAVILDTLWVIGSGIILLTGQPALTAAGKWIVVLLADVVLIFAVLQGYGLRRQHKDNDQKRDER